MQFHFHFTLSTFSPSLSRSRSPSLSISLPVSVCLSLSLFSTHFRMRLFQCKANKNLFCDNPLSSAQLSSGEARRKGGGKTGEEVEEGNRLGSFNFSLAQFVNHTKQKVKKKMAKVFNNYCVGRPPRYTPTTHTTHTTHTQSQHHTHTCTHTDVTHMAHFRCQLLSYFMYCAA